MDVLNNDSVHLFSLPVALIFSNITESSSDSGEIFSNDSTLTGDETHDNESWKKGEIFSTDIQKLEKLGETLRRELKWAFIFHTYGFGSLFFILAFYTFFSILNIRSFISTRPFMSTINGFLCLLGSSRAASMFIDPYNLKENMPKLVGQVLWDVGFPSIISAFCLVQLAFLQLTQVQIGPEGLRQKSCLSLIITAHFLLTIGMDIVVTSHENLKIVKHVIQYVFLTWGVFLCSHFLYSGYKVMSMIKSVPGGLKHRNFPDPNCKGIMQLAMLAPHNNLAGSMTAALLPTLCAPKIHQQDNTNLSAIGFRNDGNSRILESESIPMLEEITGSSGDEISPKSLMRVSSFQNQTRHSQKFNLKPKLSLKNGSDETSVAEVLPSDQVTESKSPTVGNWSPKQQQTKTVEFTFDSGKPICDIFKPPGILAKTRSDHELKSKMSFENENFYFSGEKKCKSCERTTKTGTNKAVVENLLPGVPASSPNNLEVTPGKISGNRKKGKQVLKEKNEENLKKIMNEIRNDLNEMRIVREERNLTSQEVAEVEKFQKEKSRGIVGIQSEGSLGECGKELSSDEVCHLNGCRKEATTFETSTNNRVSLSAAIKEVTKMEEIPQKFNNRRKTKSLTWKRREMDEEENATQESLIPQENPSDMSLRSVLNHIAYINRGGPVGGNEDDLEKMKKSKLEWVLNITYITAMWGLMLCLSNMGRIYSPFELPESRKNVSLNSTDFGEVRGGRENVNGLSFSSWPWLWFQTFCRALELAMGCAMANITRQPAANHRYP